MRKAVLLMALLLLFAAPGCKDKQRQPAEAKDIRLKVVVGPELRPYIENVREEFYMTAPQLYNGSKVKLDIAVESGVSAARKISTGEIKGDAWIAPSSALVNFTNQSIINLGAKQKECLSLFNTPVVIAVKPEHATMLGATEQQRVSLLRLFPASSPDQEAKAPFTPSWSHGQPRASVTGLAALIQLAYAATETAQPLSIEQLASPAVIDRLKRFEQLVYAYPMSEDSMLSKTAHSGDKQPRLALVTEQELFAYNQQQKSDSSRVQALYPEEGSYQEDYQICTSDADWVTPANAAALKIFSTFLQSDTARGIAQRSGFRIEENRADGEKTPQQGRDMAVVGPAKILPPVPGQAVPQLLQMWTSVKRPVALVMLLDASGSMEGDPINTAKEQFRKVIAQMPATDLKAILTLGKDITLVSNFTSNNSELIKAFDAIPSLGGTAVFDGIVKAYDLFDRPELGSYRKMIMVFSDGNDNTSEISRASLLGILSDKSSQRDINLVVILIAREGSSFPEFQQLVESCGGILKVAPLVDMDSVFQEVARSL